MSRTLKATVLVSAGKGTSVTTGQTIVQGPLTAVLQDVKTRDLALAEAHTQARILSQEMGIATVTLVDFVLDGLPIKLAPRVIDVYGSGKRLVVGTANVMEAALQQREMESRVAVQQDDIARLFGGK